MKRYTLAYANGHPSEEIEAANDADAEVMALEIIGGDAIAAQAWESHGWRDETPTKRLLIWATEGDSTDDPGSQSVAELITTGDA